MPQEQILNIVVAGIKKDDKWLFIKRRRGDYLRKWALIGGKMKFDEKIKEALLREIKEETGLVVEWRGVKGILNERLEDRKTGHTLKHFIIVLCLTVVKGGKLVESEEGELNAWGIAWIYFAMNDHENALLYFEKSLEQAIEKNWFGNYKYFITNIDDLKVLQGNSRFQALLDKVNAYQVGSSG